MKLISDNLHIDFVGLRRKALLGSSLVVLAAVVVFVLMGGFNYGIDFRGGSVVQVQFGKTHAIGEIRDALNAGNVPSFQLQVFGDESANEYLISLAEAESEHMGDAQTPAARVEAVLAETFDDITIRRVESVGPRVGDELKEKALEAILFSLGAILLYTWFRFQWRFGVGAVVALMHDIVIVLGAFVLTQKEISLPVVAAVLTVAGYSINDSIVIFDRIRENLRKFQKMELAEVFNASMNQTLSRTLLTSGTTLFVVLSIFIFGGEIINDFAFALLLGVIVGTYSSLFVAAPVGYLLQVRFPPRARS